MNIRITFRSPTTDFAHRFHRTFCKIAVWMSHYTIEDNCKLICCKKKLTSVPRYWINTACHTMTYNLPLDKVAGNGVYRPHIELSWPRLHHNLIHLRPEIVPLFALTVRKYIKCNYCGVWVRADDPLTAQLLHFRRHLWWTFIALLQKNEIIESKTSEW